MKWNIIADSSCDLKSIAQVYDNIEFFTVPFTINIGDDSYIDDESLDTSIMVKAMENCAHASQTTCPSPYSWYEQFKKAEQCIAITISGQLSGSYNSANVAREMMLEKNFKENHYLRFLFGRFCTCFNCRKLHELIENQLCLRTLSLKFAITSRRCIPYLHCPRLTILLKMAV